MQKQLFFVMFSSIIFVGCVQKSNYDELQSSLDESLMRIEELEMKLSLKNEEELNFKRLIDSWNGSNNSDKNEILLHLRNELRKMQIDHEECIKRSEELESDLSRAKLRLKAIEITEAMKGVN